MNEGFEKKYYLAQGQVRSVTVQKRGWPQPLLIHLETVEISPAVCCFECGDERLFTVGDELHFIFDLGKGLFKASAVILAVAA